MQLLRNGLRRAILGVTRSTGTMLCFVFLAVLCGCSALKTDTKQLPLTAEQNGLNDPFLQTVSYLVPVPAGVEEKENTVFAAVPAIPEELVPDTEILPETEEQRTITAAEQAEMLADNLWVKNVALLKFQETGKIPEKEITSSARQRRDEINRLNMSNKELAKVKNKKYEYISGLTSDWRWMHRGAEQLLKTPETLRSSPLVFLQSQQYKDKKYRTLRANAAIFLGRDGNEKVKEYLLQLVQTETMPVNLRCAALETLGRMENVSEKDLLPLLEKIKKVDELWEEMLYALAENIEPWTNPCFLEPLTASSFDVRYSTVKIWRIRSEERTETEQKKRLPDAYLDYAKRETNPQIRVEIIKTLALWKVPDLYKLLAPDLNRSAEVRNAAMFALAETQCLDAVPAIKDKLHDKSGVNRAAAVKALRILGCVDDVLKQAKDEDQRVRYEVAKIFGEKCTPHVAITAKKYIGDRYEKVQSATLESVTRWNIEESGLVLLEALKSPFPKIRQRAVDLLSKNDIRYESYNPLDLPKNQAENIQELTLIFQDKIGVVSAETAENEENEDKPPRKTKKSVSVPETTDTGQIAILQMLETGTVQEQRKAAMELAKNGNIETPSAEVTKRILNAVAQQNDPLILTTLLSALKNADPVLVSPLAKNLIQAEQPEIRRAACEMLKQFGDAGDLPLLEKSLHDPSKAVVRGALQAIDKLCGEESAPVSSINSLKELMYKSDPLLQADIAATLHRLGCNEGAESLRRLAVSKDVRLKCYIAKTVAGLQDETFIPLLIGYLDDPNGSVRNEALKALPALTGKDVAGDAGSHTAEISQSQRQISQWKTWAASRKQ